jgi:hypothetical protein
MQLKKISLLLSGILCALLTIPAWVQSLTTGDIAGTVLDPSGAALPNIPVTLTNLDNGAKQMQNTNTTGAYRFALYWRWRC